MDSKAWQRAEELFHRASELPESEREAYLLDACSDDEEILHQVRRLLAAEDAGATGSFIEDAIVDAATSIVVAEEAAQEGRRLGPYRILREIGAGGMGTVYLAERADDEFDKQVAIKLVRGGIPDEAGRTRFLAERQILARLEHPGIARLLDGGTTEDGVPFVVMEYVDGRPITAFADGAALTTEDRLWLFLEVCGAVQYAHNNLVVHRDLKPGNIFVGEDGTPKLLDFGIAKLMEGDPASGATLALTGAGRLMTPEYASPEQVSGDAVGTATDVYALGVLLYELLTGRLPFELAGRTAAEIHQVVVTREPERPSRVALAGRALSGDLDHIVLKALRKEPERRYLSVSQLADDITAYLTGMPVSARPNSFGYRARKFAARNRIGVAATLGVLALSTWYTVSLAAERDAAQVEARKAERVAEFVQGLFRVSDPDAYQDREITARELLDSGAVRLRTELLEEPEVRGRMMGLIGTIYSELGLTEDALALLSEALEVSETALGEDSNEAISIRHDMAAVLVDRGELEEAVTLARSILEVRRAQRPLDRRNLIASLVGLVEPLRLSGEREEAEAIASEAVAMARLLDEPLRDTLLGTTLNDRGIVRIQSGRFEEARADLEEALALHERTHHPLHPNVLAARGNLGQALGALGRYDEAADMARSLLAAREQVYGPDHPSVANSLNSLSSALKQQGHYAEAEQHQRRALEINLTRYGPRSPSVVTNYNNLANLRQDQGDLQGALDFHDKSLSLALDLHGEASEQSANSYYNMAAVYQELGDLDRAFEYQSRALRVDSLTLGPDHPFIVQDLTSLGVTLTRSDDHQGAEPLFRQAIELGTRVLGPDHPNVGRAHRELSRALIALDRPGEAVTSAREALRILASALDEDHWEVGAMESVLGEALWRNGEADEAEPLLRRGYETLRASQGDDHRRTMAALRRLELLSGG